MWASGALRGPGHVFCGAVTSSWFVNTGGAVFREEVAVGGWGRVYRRRWGILSEGIMVWRWVGDFRATMETK